MDLTDMDLGVAYFIFSLVSAFGALWMMQRTTADAGFSGSLPLIKLGHRAISAIASVTMFAAAMDTLYYDTEPRLVDFVVQFVLVSVLTFSALRHMAAAPTQSQHNPTYQLQR